jgi:NAD(P)-dependent dehydrogenase (short-subunit alcohol dehydrogenase family)
MAHANRLQKTHVLVFGGTSGIGFAVANMALSSGAIVTISGSNQQKVDSKVALLRSYYPYVPSSSVSGYAIDLLDTKNLEANLVDMFEFVTEGGMRKVDHVALTAGDIPVLQNVKDVTPEGILSGFQIRLVAAAIVAKLLAVKNKKKVD